MNENRLLQLIWGLFLFSITVAIPVLQVIALSFGIAVSVVTLITKWPDLKKRIKEIYTKWI